MGDDWLVDINHDGDSVDGRVIVVAQLFPLWQIYLFTPSAAPCFTSFISRGIQRRQERDSIVRAFTSSQRVLGEFLWTELGENGRGGQPSNAHRPLCFLHLSVR